MEIEKKSKKNSYIKFILLSLIVFFIGLITILVYNIILSNKKPVVSTKTKAADMTYKKVIDLSSRELVESSQTGSLDQTNMHNTISNRETQTMIITPTDFDVRTTPKTDEFKELIDMSPTPTSIFLADSTTKNISQTPYTTSIITTSKAATQELPAAGTIHLTLLILITSIFVVFFSLVL